MGNKTSKKSIIITDYKLLSNVKMCIVNECAEYALDTKYCKIHNCCAENCGNKKFSIYDYCKNCKCANTGCPHRTLPDYSKCINCY